MEVANLLIYMILIIVLVSLIGVSGWLLYDYNNLKTQLSGDFKTISNRFSTHKTKDNTLESGLNTNTSNITSTKTELTESIETVKNDLIDSVNKIDEKTINHDAKLTAFNENLSKYFILGTDETSVSAVSDSLFSWFTSDYDNGNKLKLIKETIIASELTINDGATLNTNSDKKLKVCDNSGGNCSDIYKNSNDLIIKNDNGGRIIIGSGNDNNSLIIENGTLKFNNTDLLSLGQQKVTKELTAAADKAVEEADKAVKSTAAASTAAAAAALAVTKAAAATAVATDATDAVTDATEAVKYAVKAATDAVTAATEAEKAATEAETAAKEAEKEATEAEKAATTAAVAAATTAAAKARETKEATTEYLSTAEAATATDVVKAVTAVGQAGQAALKAGQAALKARETKEAAQKQT